MIELKVAGFCHNCTEFEPEVDRDILHDYNFFGECEERMVLTKVACIHEHRCRSMVNFLETQRKEKPDGK